MDKSEHQIQDEIRLKLGIYNDITIFRANVGEGWTGSIISRNGKNVSITDARRFKTGMPKGFPDLFGFRRIVITPDMVGKTMPIFAFIEVKTPHGRASKEQKHMHEFLRDAGAVGGIARSADEADDIIHAKI
jgi:hypothetical protein